VGDKLNRGRRAGRWPWEAIRDEGPCAQLSAAALRTRPTSGSSCARSLSPISAPDKLARIVREAVEAEVDAAADHYVYALTDYREVDRTIALARVR
jgi:hypothetical protein